MHSNQASLSILTSLSERVRTQLLEIAVETDYSCGEVIHEQGQPRNCLRLVREGHVEVSRERGGTTIPVIIYGPGDVLGEGMLVSKASHPTTAIAKTQVIVLEIARDSLDAILSEDEAMRIELLETANKILTDRFEQLLPGVMREALQFGSGDTRLEHDLIGNFEVPTSAYYGVHTARAMVNFRISRTSISHYPDLIIALAMVKRAAAEANCECGVLSPQLRKGIAGACLEIEQGKLHSHFVLDMIQGGAGTSTNMNANEVIANRALELMGMEKGQYSHCHPNNHVNCSQSTNDAYPTALKLAMARCNRRLGEELELLVASFRAKAHEFKDVVKMGRTQLQDAVPMTLGQEFEAWAASIEHEADALRFVGTSLLQVNMGGTAIGTGLNAPTAYAERCVKHLKIISGFRVSLAKNLIESTQDTQAFVLFASTLKSLAVKLSKISNDLRLLSSGPRAGFGDISLPPRQAGSSIMPGKVNPVIPEVVNQTCFRVIANDVAVSLGAEAGQLQLNVMEPVIAACNLESVAILMNASRTLRQNCIDGIECDQEALRKTVERSIGLVTALVPVLGYETATELAGEALGSGRGIIELVREKELLTEEQITQILSADNMTSGGFSGRIR